MYLICNVKLHYSYLHRNGGKYIKKLLRKYRAVYHREQLHGETCAMSSWKNPICERSKLKYLINFSNKNQMRFID